MSKHFEDELEILMLHNPRGGKPQKIGATLWTPLQPKGSVVEISELKEDTTMRFHLGYCSCGNKIVTGEKRALILIKTLKQKLGIDSDEVLEVKILKHVLAHGRETGC